MSRNAAGSDDEKSVVFLRFKEPGKNSRRVVSSGDYTITYLDIDDFTLDLSSFNGVIVPSGVFETIDRKSTAFGTDRYISFDEGVLLKRHREILSLQGTRSYWICILLDEVIDWNQRAHEYAEDWRNTDLAKLILNTLSVQRKEIHPTSEVRSIVGEFSGYINKFGVASTELSGAGMKTARILALVERDICVGAVFADKTFVLPFHSGSIESFGMEAMLRLCRSIDSYIAKSSVNLPSWLSELSFVRESEIASEQAEMYTRLEMITEERQKIIQYKGVLTNTGGILVQIVGSIFSGYFDLDVDFADHGIQDMTIKDSSKPLCFVEIKGIKGGLKREHLNQADSHRERNGLDSSFPCLLVINDFMGKEGIESRRASKIEPQHLRHAENTRVKVLRAIDLLTGMVSCQHLPIERRKELILEILLQEECGKIEFPSCVNSP